MASSIQSIVLQKKFLLTILSLLFLLTGCQGPFWEKIKKEEQQLKETLGIKQSQSNASSPIEDKNTYQIQVEGLPGDLLPLYESHSNLFEFMAHPPETLEGLERRAWTDLPVLEKILRAGGYYEGRVEFEVNKGLVKVKVHLGNPFTIEEINLEGAPEVSLPTFEDLQVGPGAVVNSKNLLDVEETLKLALSEEGYPFAKVTLQPIDLHCTTKTVSVVFKVQAGPLTLFGPIHVDNLEHLPKKFIKNLIFWKEGERFDSRLLEKFRHALIVSNIFSVVDVNHPSDLNPEDVEEGVYKMPIHVHAVVGKTRYVGAGLQYASTEGASVKFFWGNYNFREVGEQLYLMGQVGRKKSLLEVTHTHPQFLQPNLNWTTSLKGIKEWTPAYKKKGGSLLGALTKEFSEQFSASIGVGYEISRLYKEVGWRKFHFPAFPFELTYGQVDNILNPTQGWRVSAEVTFYPKILGALSTFIQAYMKPALFIPLGQKWVVGLWAGLGVLSGDQKSDFPPDHLFYAGGAGSVRGYKAQMLGPLDAKNKPLGGRSILEGGIECTFRSSDSLGWVVFYEWGNVFSASTPQVNFRWGAGFGIRYFTAIGPLRLDIAFPLNRRPGIDGKMQIYAGVGASF